MGKTKYGIRYPEELRARALRMVSDHESEYANRSAEILSISHKVGCSRDSLRIWVKQHETDNLAGFLSEHGETQLDFAKINIEGAEYGLLLEAPL
ncbi:hypothetical protein E2K80_06170 [Rhodophyticola sp. CCM32]|uniref:hypothetical protein n=1 Tax=Rhodophyticola sp. CCM32 TaxID=2916397 RepID=UPI00107F594B|nr:hypothetical protein [Rhodophyticola sp. CCM32]QBY00377.1 hypothetical protein E2K80_06170 [Rhodophyticola sp. CCM32]